MASRISNKAALASGGKETAKTGTAAFTRFKEKLFTLIRIPSDNVSGDANAIRVQQIATLISRTPVLAAANLVNSALAAVVFWDFRPQALLLIWLALMWLGALDRLRRWWTNRSRPIPPKVGRRAIVRSTALAAATGCLWGFAGCIFFPADSLVQQVFLTFLVGGMAGAGAIGLSIVPSVSLAFVLPTLLPIVGRFAVQGDSTSLVMAAMLVVCTLALLAISRNAHEAFIKLVRAEHENTKLLAALGLERKRLEIQVTERTVQLERVNRRLEADISKRQDAEAAIRESEQKFRDIAEVASDWIWETDDRHRLTYVSKRWTDMTGLNVSGVLGKTRWELVGDDLSAPEWRQHFTDLEEHRAFRNFRYTYVAPEGSVYCFSVSGKPVLGAKGEFRGYRGTGSDVTAEIEAARSLASAAHAADVANQAKSQFLANISHELRTPLNAVVGFSDIMQQQLFGALDHRYAEYARDIHGAGAHLLELINEILDFSKIESGKFELQEDKVSVPEIIETANRFFRRRIEEEDLRVKTALPRSLPMVHADGRALKQILLNLISNAIKFTPCGGHLEIAAAIDRKGRMCVSVADTGIGIAKNDIKRVTAAFEQAGDVTQVPKGGTGLGLAIAESLVELHGGTLTIKSKVGAGTTVSFVLPPERLLGSQAPLST